MSTLQTIWLSIVQGLTEFLPVSSSGHLILFSKFANFPDQGLAVDVALHKDVGDGDHAVLYAGGQTVADDLFQAFFVETDFFQADAVGGVYP